MKYLGIVSCRILELEFAYLFEKDPSIDEICVIVDRHSVGLVDKLAEIGDPRVRHISAVDEFRATDTPGRGVIVRILELGLHSVIKGLRDGVVTATEQLAPHVRAVMLGYGLCGNALDKPEKLFADCSVPVIVPVDEDHPVDDCIGLLIGGRETYYEEQCKCAGTMFMNSGFARHWKTMLAGDRGTDYSPKMAKRLFAAYKRSLLLPTEVMGSEEMTENIREFNEVHGLEIESRAGTLHILMDTWSRAKEAAFGTEHETRISQ